MFAYTWPSDRAASRRQILNSVRALISAVCLALEAFGSGISHPGFLFAFSAYAVYSIAALFWSDLDQALRPTWSLAIDTTALAFALLNGNPHFAYAAIVLYVFVVSTAVLLHKWWHVAAIAVLSLALVKAAEPPHAAVLFPGLVGAGIVAGVLAFDRHSLRERVATLSEQNLLYRADADQARQAERKRIAADFHDGPLQSFISVQMRLEVIRRLLASDPKAALDHLVRLQESCRTQVQEFRAFLGGPNVSETPGSLNSLLRRTVDQFSKDSGIPASLISTEFVDLDTPEVSLELVQIVREALHNVQKHSSATRVEVGISTYDDTLEISVQDNGKGFPFSGSYNLEEMELLSIGPRSVKRRVRSLGGEMLLDSRPGHGAELKIRLNA